MESDKSGQSMRIGLKIGNETEDRTKDPGRWRGDNVRSAKEEQNKNVDWQRLNKLGQILGSTCFRKLWLSKATGKAVALGDTVRWQHGAVVIGWVSLTVDRLQLIQQEMHSAVTEWSVVQYW